MKGFVVIILFGMLIVAGCLGERGNPTNQTNITNTTNSSNSTCHPNAVYFIHADWCSHCAKMKPLVQQLEGQGYKFIWTNVDNKTALQEASTCLQGIAQMKYVPEFACISSGKSHVGEFGGIDEMRSFVSECGVGQ